MGEVGWLGIIGEFWGGKPPCIGGGCCGWGCCWGEGCGGCCCWGGHIVSWGLPYIMGGIMLGLGEASCWLMASIEVMGSKRPLPWGTPCGFSGMSGGGDNFGGDDSSGGKAGECFWKEGDMGGA